MVGPGKPANGEINRSVRNGQSGSHFLSGHQKVILHPIACIDCMRSPRPLRELGTSAGGIYLVFIFCIRIRVGVGGRSMGI